MRVACRESNNESETATRSNTMTEKRK